MYPKNYLHQETLKEGYLFPGMTQAQINFYNQHLSHSTPP